MTFPRFSIASKLYAIFGLLATATLVLAAVGIVNSRQHAAMTEQFERAFLGSMSVERVNGLIYALVMDERGIYMSADTEAAKPYTDGLLKHSDSITKVVDDWKTRVGPDDAVKFSEFAERVGKFQTFQKELVRLAVDVGPEAVRIVGDNPDNQRIRVDLNKDIEALAQLYASRSRTLYGQVEDSIAGTSLWMTVLGVFAVALAGLGAFMIWRICIRPLNDITRVTEAVAQGRDVEIPHRGRNDEIGALAKSIAVFQGAMRSNSELNETVTHDAQERAQRQEMVGQEIARFGSDIESSISELMTLSNEVHQNSQHIAEGVSTTSELTARAATASNEASSNVGDIASAAEELTASVQEIERQVAQSNDIAMKAVNEAAQTNMTVQELNEAASRIGDVVKLINDIAAQTNLLALNATIEAARAGDAGRGFAVVAGEVKALAGQTAKATDEITSQIAAMQSATVRSIEAIGAIERTIREIGDISGAIAAAVTEQGAATQEIARSVETASKRTAEAAEQVGGVSGVAETASRHASEARLVADNLGSVAARIRGQVDDFFERLKAA